MINDYDFIINDNNYNNNNNNSNGICNAQTVQPKPAQGAKSASVYHEWKSVTYY